MNVEMLWTRLQERKTVFIVLEGGAIPYVEHPSEVEQEWWVPDGEEHLPLHEGALSVFIELEAAEAFKRFLIESQDWKPSELSIMELSLESVFSLIDEVDEVFRTETGYGFRIDVVERLEDFVIITDTLHSKVAQYN